jgi:signal transduction histidine kinase
MRCPRCQHENSSRAKFCEECGTPLGRSNESGSYADLERALSEALEQQAATAEILRVISSSRTDVEPVFQMILSSTNRLCEASFSVLWLWDGEALIPAAHVNVSPGMAERLRSSRALPRRGGTPVALTALEKTVIHIPDVLEDPRFSPSDVPSYRLEGARSILAVPMLREGSLVGVINTWRREPRAFTDKQVELLKTFADQAVIAIENVRLFKELEEKNLALTKAHAQVTETLEQQTATAEILRVISSAQRDVQPVFDTIVQSATRLCNATTDAVFRTDGSMLYHPANYGGSPEALAAMRARYPRPVGMDTAPGIAVLTRSVFHVPDIEDPSVIEQVRQVGRVLGFRSAVTVPMLYEDEAVGAIVVTRREPGRFSDAEVEVLRTFADQAVIAIENVRLFKELEARNRDLTATGEILQVIARSPTDVQPVFDTIVRSAGHLCEATFSAVVLVDGDELTLVAAHGEEGEAMAVLRDTFPRPLGRDTATGRAVIERRAVHLPDVQADQEYHSRLRAGLGTRTMLAVPMLREGAPIGSIGVWRHEVRPFTDNQLALLETFADQAVIAIENVRLFKELEARTGELTRSVGELTALGEVSQALSSTLDIETVLDTIVSRASQLVGDAGCSIYEYDEATEHFELRATHHYDADFVEALRAAPLRKGEGLMGRATKMREPIQIPDIAQPGAYQSSVRDTLIRFGYRALLSVPLLREDQIIGSLSFNRKAPGEFPAEVVDVLKTFATQSALAIQNARLFREIADKSRQLEVASRHKSEFLANMSHELRTPLNAIIGFSEVLAEKMFGEVNAKQAEYLQDILESGRHLLSLINDILDLSKIEAGHMELEPADFDLPSAIDNALTLVRERATRHGITLGSTIDERLGMVRGDERKVKQILLNLLSNALKFTPEGGRIDVGAGWHDEVAEVSVADTGIGIAPADQEAVFEEFRQVGAAEKRAEGTGLGLALTRKFVELHGGKIWVRSEVGRGSTFTFTLPVGSGLVSQS